MVLTQEHISGLVEQYGDMVLRLSYTYLKNKADAEDVVQDVFLKIIEKHPDFNDTTHEKSWIMRVTVNTCKNKLKLFWNRNRHPIDEVTETASYDAYHTDSNVLKAIMSLPDKYRIVVYMYYYEEYPTPDISKIIGKSETTVRSLLHRARNRLKDMLKEEYDFE